MDITIGAFASEVFIHLAAEALLGISKGVLRWAQTAGHGFYVEACDATILHYNRLGIELQKKYFDEMINDPTVGEMLGAFSSGKTEINFDVLASAFSRTGFYYDVNNRDALCRQIVTHFMNRLISNILRDTKTALPFLFSVIQVHSRNQTEISRSLVLTSERLLFIFQEHIGDIKEKIDLIPKLFEKLDTVNKELKKLIPHSDSGTRFSKLDAIHIAETYYAFYRRGNLSLAQKIIEEGIDLFENEARLDVLQGILDSYFFQTKPRTTKRAFAHLWRGVIFLRQGKFDLAITEYRQSLSIYNGLHDKIRAAECLNEIGHTALLWENNHQKAIRYFRKGLRLLENVSQRKLRRKRLRKWLGWFHYNIGVTYLKEGRYGSAVDELKRGISICAERGVNDEIGIVHGLQRLMEVHLKVSSSPSHYKNVLDILANLLAIVSQYLMVRPLVRILGQLSYVHYGLGNHGDALKCRLFQEKLSDIYCIDITDSLREISTSKLKQLNYENDVKELEQALSESNSKNQIIEIVYKMEKALTIQKIPQGPNVISGYAIKVISDFPFITAPDLDV